MWGRRLAIDADEARAIADRILAASVDGAPIAPISDSRPDFGLHAAYAVAAAVTARRRARGERPIGWKIGFTNTTIWDEYGVHAPIWGPMYDTTVAAADPGQGAASCSLAALMEPRLEPEIALRIGAPPHPEMDVRDLIACVDGVAHGFEVVQSVFPGWRFRAPDTAAAFALHGRYMHGPFVPVAAADRDAWLDRLAGFTITLYRNEEPIDRGEAANVLGGGPVVALRHLARGLTRHSPGYRLNAGDIVTTGTVTRAFPVAPGETWRTEIEGLPVRGMTVAFV
jgi:2-oxo-3-hexenedioate decarboxylase